MFAGILLPIRSLPVMDLISSAGFNSVCAPARIRGAAGARPAPTKAHTYEVHIFNAGCGPLKLESISAGRGSACVTYKDLLTNATITLAGKASGVAGASNSQATSRGDLVADGHQGSFPGLVPRVDVEYTMTRQPRLSCTAPRSRRRT